MDKIKTMFFFSSRRRHTRCSGVSWARRGVYETEDGKRGRERERERERERGRERTLQNKSKDSRCLIYTSDAAEK